jgi:hypothetical protein
MNPKQHRSMRKAFSDEILRVTLLLREKRLEEKNAKINLMKRFKGVQRRYGFWNCQRALPELIKVMKETPRTRVFFKGKYEIVSLYWEPLEEFYNGLLSDTIVEGE